jgi:hypothetical protein
MEYLSTLEVINKMAMTNCEYFVAFGVNFLMTIYRVKH